MIRCGNPVHKSINAAAEAHHDSVAQVRLCYVRPVRSIEENEADEYSDDMYDPLADYEFFLETRETSDGLFGSDGLYDLERENGCISYEEARRRAEEANEDHAQEVRAGI